MKRLPLLLPALFLALLLSACGGSGTTGTTQKNFLDSLYHPGTYRTTLDSIRIHENLNKAELDELKAFMRENGDFITADWTYRDIHESASGFARSMKAPIGMKITGLSPRTDRKIAEFRLDMDFRNGTDMQLKRFHAALVWLDKEGQELDRSPRFAVDKDLKPGQWSGELHLQYAYYRPTGNEMNQASNEKLRRKVDDMLDLAKGGIDSSRFRLEVTDLLLANGKTVHEHWRTHPDSRAKSQDAAASGGSMTPLLSWADKNQDWVDKLQNPVGSHFFMVTPILTDKFESTHGIYLLFDRIDKFTAFFTGQKHIPEDRVITAPAGKLVLNEVIDYWKWPMEFRIYEL